MCSSTTLIRIQLKCPQPTSTLSIQSAVRTCHLPCHTFHVAVHHGRRSCDALYIVLCPLCVQGDGEGRGPLTGQMPNVRARGWAPDARNFMCVSSWQPTPARGVVSRVRACARAVGDEWRHRWCPGGPLQPVDSCWWPLKSFPSTRKQKIPFLVWDKGWGDVEMTMCSWTSPGSCPLVEVVSKSCRNILAVLPLWVTRQRFSFSFLSLIAHYTLWMYSYYPLTSLINCLFIRIGIYETMDQKISWSLM